MAAKETPLIGDGRFYPQPTPDSSQPIQSETTLASPMAFLPSASPNYSYRGPLADAIMVRTG